MSSSPSLLARLLKGRGDKGWSIQFVQHLVSGGIATAGHYLVMLMALRAGVSPLLATSLGFLVGASTRFGFSYFYIFEPEARIPGALVRFILQLGLQMVLNAGLLSLLLGLSIPVWPAQLLTTGLLTVLNFVLAKFWVFR